MDYKTDIESKIRNTSSSTTRMLLQIQDLQKQVNSNKFELEAYLNKSLEAMCSELSSRKDVTETLSKEEQDTIQYVESGKFQQDLESMPKILAQQLQKSTNELYKKAKKKAPQKELSVCGFLDFKEAKDPNITTLQITLPVRYDRRHQEGSLEEALYLHNVVKGNFVSEGVYNEYVTLLADVPKEKANDAVKDITTRFEKIPTASLLAKANVRYGVVQIREAPVPEKPIHEGYIKKISKTPEELPEMLGMKKYYYTDEALKTWEAKLKEQGKNIPKKNLRRIIGYTARASNKGERYFNFIHEGRLLLLEKQSFDKFISENTLEKRKERYRVKPFTQAPESIIPDSPSDIEQKVSYAINEAAELWRQEIKTIGLVIPYYNTYHIIDKKLRGIAPQRAFKEIRKGSKRLIDKESFDSYISNHIIKPIENGIKVHEVVPRPKSILDLIENEMSFSLTKRYLLVSTTTLNRYIERRKLTQTSSGSISGDSLKEFYRTMLRQGGKDKTRWVEWKGKSKDPDYIPVSHEISYHDAADILDVNVSYLYRHIAEFEKTQDGFVTRESVDNFLKSKTKAGGKYKTLDKD